MGYAESSSKYIFQDHSISGMSQGSSGNELAADGINPSCGDLHNLLICCLRSGDELLWAEFVRRTRPVISNSIRKAMQCRKRFMPALVEDLVQEVFLKLLAHDARVLRGFVYRHENALSCFLRVVSSNVVRDHFRCSYSKKRGSGREAEDLERVAVAGRGSPIMRGASVVTLPDVERYILFQQIENCMLKHMGNPTSARDWTIFKLYYKEGLTAKAIAHSSSIGLSVKGIESTLLRITRLIRLRIGT